MNSWWIGLLAASFVTACASQQPDLYWGKEGASSAERDAASYECERDTRAAAVSFGRNAYDAREFYVKCMNVKGFHLTQFPSSSTSDYVKATPMADTTGRHYGSEDIIVCSFDGGVTAKVKARVCSQGGGTITGPA